MKLLDKHPEACAALFALAIAIILAFVVLA
jgi:hypothetical protein